MHSNLILTKFKLNKAKNFLRFKTGSFSLRNCAILHKEKLILNYLQDHVVISKSVKFRKFNSCETSHYFEAMQKMMQFYYFYYFLSK